MEIADATHMGPVELSVSDLERSLDYWQNTVGLRVLSRDDGRASLGAGSRELIRFVEEPGARSARGYAGLYHVALLLPERRDLARWLAHAAQAQIGLEGLSDHAVSEAIYLRDPDGHGIEIYADRPREQWEGHVRELMTTRPLDVGSLFEELDEPPTAEGGVSGPGVGGSADDASSPRELPDGTVVGHTHLCVSDIESTVHFYVDELGFELMAQLGPMAAFLAAGGYHHHVGANIWESRGAGKAPAGTARLLRATILVPDAEELERIAGRLGVDVEDGGIDVEDPSGNPLFLTL